MNNIVEPSFLLAVKVWWAWAWRSMLTVLALSMLAGFFFGIMGALMGIEQNTVSTIAGLTGFCIGLYFTVFFIKRLMVKGFGKYRLQVVEKE